jgi:cold shock CspA family protein
MSSETKSKVTEFDNTYVFSGRVKWFNNKNGYGFITSCDDKNKDEDVFVHHSGVSVSEEQYKYLVQGEYVEFKLTGTSDDSKYPYQASSVTGMWGGKLMCETRNEMPAKARSTNQVKRHQYTKPSVEQTA